MDFDEIYGWKYKEALQVNNALEKQLKMLKDFSKRFESIVDDNQTSREELRKTKENRINKHNEYIQQCEKELEDFEVNMANKEQTIEKQAEEITELSAKAKEDKVTIKKYKSEKEKLLQEIRAHQKEIDRLKQQIEEYLKKWKYCLTHHNEQEIAAQRAEVAGLEEELEQLQDEHDGLKRECDRVQNEDPELLDLKNQLRAKEGAYSDINKNNQQLRNQLNSVRENIRLKDLFQSDLQKEIRDKGERIESIAKRIVGLKDKLKELEQDRDEKDRLLAEQTSKLDEENKRLEDVKEQIPKAQPSSRRGSSSGGNFSFEGLNIEVDNEENDDDFARRMSTLKRRVRYAVKTILSLRSQFAEIRRYDKMPRVGPLKILMCGLYLTDHISSEEFVMEITEIVQWNYLKNFYGYSLVIEFSRFDIEEHLSDYDIPIIENIRTAMAHIDIDDVNQYSRCIGALQEWMQTMLMLYDAKVEQLEREGKERPINVKPVSHFGPDYHSPLKLKTGDDDEDND